MEDVDGPIIAPIFYKELFAGDVEFFRPEDIPYALDKAVSQLRQLYPEPNRWATYIHMGI